MSQLSSRAVGVGRVLIAVYAILALAATARSVVQLAGRFDEAPVAYLLSAFAGLVYVLATVALIGKGRGWYTVAWVAISVELLGVLVVGTLSLVHPEYFPDDTVWSVFGRGYLFIPLVLPILGLLWLVRTRPRPEGVLMQFWTRAGDVPAGFGPSAVTVGKFDGLHAGHRAVIDRLRAIAGERGLVPTVVTFDRNPLSLLRPELCPDPLVSNAQKAELLEAAGVDATLMVTFDDDFRVMTAEEFVQRILVDALHASVVLVGGDFRFGARGAGDVALLQTLGAQYGFEVVTVDDVTPDGPRRVSSTWVRELLADGDVRGAARLLGTLPCLRATVVHGAHRGRELGYPTANLAPDLEGFTPADGVYAAWLTVRGERHGAAVSIGNNPTFDGVPARQVEAHALDQDFDIYGETVTLEFVDHIRGMIKYTTVEALVEQIARDEEVAREILGLPPRAGS